MNAKQWVYTLADIAVAAGRKPELVRLDRRKRKFNPACLASVSEYVAGCRLCRSAGEYDEKAQEIE